MRIAVMAMTINNSIKLKPVRRGVRMAEASQNGFPALWGRGTQWDSGPIHVLNQVYEIDRFLALCPPRPHPEYLRFAPGVSMVRRKWKWDTLVKGSASRRSNCF